MWRTFITIELDQSHAVSIMGQIWEYTSFRQQRMENNEHDDIQETRKHICWLRFFVCITVTALVVFSFTFMRAVSAKVPASTSFLFQPYTNDTQPLNAYCEHSNGTMCVEYCETPNLQVLSKTKRYWWFYVVIVVYKAIDTGLKFWNMVDECKHFDQSFQNGVNCLWDVGTTVVACGGGAYKINGAIREICARYDKARLFAELPQGSWKRDKSPILDDFAETLPSNGIDLVGIFYIDRQEMTQNQLVKKDGN